MDARDLHRHLETTLGRSVLRKASTVLLTYLAKPFQKLVPPPQFTVNKRDDFLLILFDAGTLCKSTGDVTFDFNKLIDNNLISNWINLIFRKSNRVNPIHDSHVQRMSWFWVYTCIFRATHHVQVNTRRTLIALEDRLHTVALTQNVDLVRSIETAAIVKFLRPLHRRDGELEDVYTARILGIVLRALVQHPPMRTWRR